MKYIILGSLVVLLFLLFSISPNKAHNFEGHILENIEDYPDIDHEKNIFHPKNKKLLEDGSPLKLWIESENIGKLLDLHFTKTLHLTIPVNIIFVGFGGEGNRGINLSQEDLLEWFSHIEHSIKNVIVPIGEDYTTTDKINTPSTHIEYSFDLQVSKLDPMVNTLIEDAIFWHLRSESGKDQQPSSVPLDDDNGIDTIEEHEIEKKFYTNPYLVSSLLSSLCESLAINNNSYTVFVLNPNHPSTSDSGHIYGYRTGFSNLELKQLYKNPNIKIPQDISTVSTDYQFSQLLLNHNNNNHNQNNQRKQQEEESITLNNNKNIKFKDLIKKSSEWANRMIKEFNQFRTSTTQNNPNCKFTSPDGEEDKEQWSCMSLNMIKNESGNNIIDRAQDIFESGTLFEQLYVYTAHQFEITENPIVDTWISHKRFSFIDLTAGPFEWGPSIGGNGLKTFSTLPVPPFPESLLEGDLSTIKKELKTKMLSQDRLDQELLMLETIFTNNCPGYLDIKNIDQILKEKNLPDLDLKTINNLELCLSLAEKHLKLVEKNVQDIDLLLGNIEEDFGLDNNQDVFISKLGSVVSGSLRHLVAPPLPLFKIRFSQRVNFQVYVISDHKVYNPRDYFYFNYEHFKNEIEKLKLSNQEFTFTIKSIDMSQDKSLALAYHTSLKTILSPVINENGEFTTKLNYYLDSKDIKNHLNRLYLNEFNNGNDNDEDNIYQFINSNEAKYIPIFLFSLSSNQPVFIDKNHQAKSLSNMVIAVQTNVLSWPSSFSANGHQTSLYLVNPTSSILAATALNLGGLIGTHFTYSEAHHAATSNWHFSVGDSPLSKTFTFPFSYFNDFQKDIIFRNYIVSSLERSLYWINKATAMLYQQKTTVNNFPTLMSYPLEDITLNFVGIRDLWSQSSNYLKELNFKKAIQAAQESEQNAYKFYKESLSLVQFATLASCNQSNSNTFSIPKRTIAIVIITFGINFIIIVLLSLFYKKKSKLKIN